MMKMTVDDKTRYQVILESARKDIDDFIDCQHKEELYRNYKVVLEGTLLHKMRANDLSKLGVLERVYIPFPKPISLGDLRGVLKDDTILERVVFTIDVGKTIQNLKNELNLTDIGIEPIMKKILLKTEGVKETLSIEKGKENKT